MMQSTTESNNGNDAKKTSKRGFASMDPEKQREIASKGGTAVSSNHEHMAEIGRRGGSISGEARRNKSKARYDTPLRLPENNEQSDGQRA